MTIRLAVVAPNFTSPFIASVLDRLKHLCPTQIVSRIAKGETAEEQAKTLIGLIKNGTVPSGLIVISARPNADTLAMMRALNIPVILIDEQADRCASVGCDNVLGGYLAGLHLIKRGHKRLALITGRTGKSGSKNAEDRAAGFRKALTEANLRIPMMDCWEVLDYSQADGIEWHHHRPPDSTAVFCAAGDLCASGILKVAPELGVKIPEALAVVGFDDSAVAGILGLTTIRQPIKEIATLAYQMACIDPTTTLARPQRRTLPPELIVRETT
jgi:DNA-binding LacI/PurR family transcriptional regulator